jgi:hypothetical protein
MSKNTFIFFGCWNNINCEKDYIYRDIVLNSIKTFETEITDLFIAGDNWYNTLINKKIKTSDVPEVPDVQQIQQVPDVQKSPGDGSDKEKKKSKDKKDSGFKYYLIDTLVSGYHILYGMNKNIYICVGNHDESSIYKDEKKDCMIKTQKYYMNRIKREVDEANDNIDSLLLEENIPNLNDIIKNVSLDEITTVDNKNTKMKLYSNEIIGIEEKDNYIVFIINTNILSDSYLDNLNQELSKYTTEKSKNLKKIFVMGHIPLFFDKHKKEKDDVISSANDTAATKDTAGSSKKSVKKDITDIKKGRFNNSYDLIDKIYIILTRYNCTYICADCHNFNVMKIECEGKCLIQITSGTGGADPDKIIDIYDVPKKSVFVSDKYRPHSLVSQKSSERIKITYNITYYSINSYGYSTVSVFDDNIALSYNKLIEVDGGQYIDDKYRYIISNNNITYLGKETSKDKDKINDILKISMAKKELYCGRLEQNKTKNIDEVDIDNIIKSQDKKRVCYKKNKE